MVPVAPLPGMACTLSAGAGLTPWAAAWARMAWAMGWLLRASSAATRASSSASLWPFSGTTVSTASLPSVTVPVLSKATTFSRAGLSRCSPPLTRTPARAAAAMAATTVTGVEITRAQGQAMTSSTSDR